LPERDDEKVVIDKPLSFYVLILTDEQFKSLDDLVLKDINEKKIKELPGNKERLELIPRGRGRIEVLAPNLYHEIKNGDSVLMEITIRNAGTKRLDNIKVTIDKPLNWSSGIKPDIISMLAPGKEATVKISVFPPADGGVGAQDIKIKTNALVNNRKVESEDKIVRIQIDAKTPIFWTILLIFGLIAIIVGIVVFGIKISKR